MEPLTIASGQGAYRVEFRPDLERLADELAQVSGALLLLDRQLAGSYESLLAPLRSRFPIYETDATEEEKTLAGVGRFLEFLQGKGAVKQSTVIAMGGGIIQDIAAFATHIYYRGLRWIFVPTTLLAMGDSCIGAKCGINFNGYKNQLGVFHAPARVLIAPRFLDTLPDDAIRSGYGEILKMLLMGSREQYGLLARAVEQAGFRNPELPGLVRESLQLKQAVIEKDEYESDLRRILNYGHTFGHSLETASGYEIPHGLAVAWGVDLANYIARERGLLAGDDYAAIHSFIARHFACSASRPVTAAGLIEGTRRDKKVASGKLNLILLARPGELRIAPVDFDERLEREVSAYLEHDSVIHWR